MEGERVVNSDVEETRGAVTKASGASGPFVPCDFNRSRTASKQSDLASLIFTGNVEAL